MGRDRRRVGRALVDLIGASVLLAAIVVGVVSATALAVGAGAVGIKRALFAIGLLLTGVGTLLHRERTTYDRDDRNATYDRDGRNGTYGRDDRNGTSATLSRRESRLRPLLERALPDRFVLPPEERFSAATKLVGSGVITLFVSYLMERAFSVGV